MEDVVSDWFYEGRVVEALVAHLRREGWAIGYVPAAESKERGVDVTAERAGELLLIEAKGYPSTFYRDAARRGEKKPTNPTNQAQQWYSHALLKALRLQTKHPRATVAMAFPSFPRYRTLYAETAPRLRLLSVPVFFVHESGTVERLG
jgi:hypothetical protein